MKLELQKGSRSKILAGLILAIMAVFIGRLFYLQIIQHDYYVDLAKGEQVKRLTIPSKRGLIYALDGSTPVPLVMNQTVYTVFADPQTTTDSGKIVDVIRRIAGGNARASLQELLDRKDSRYQILATKVTRNQADKIKSENLKGVGFQEESQRVYPEGSLASQTLGFVDFEGTGRYGIESNFNDRLTGKDGLLQSVTDVSDVPLTIGNDNINRPAVNGENIILSIDRNVQSKVEQILADRAKLLGATNVSAIVMDPQTGKIMAMANLPTYNPAEFNKVEDGAAFNNGVVSNPYEPASVMKTFIMAAGIEKGAITPDSTYINTDHIQIDDKVISNASLGQTGEITFQHALNWSLNTGSVTVVKRLGDGSEITKGARDIVYDYFYNKFKLGQVTGVEVDGETPGMIISPDDPDGNAVRYSNMSFGQGLSVTMVQVAAAFSAIVNGGNYYKPTVIAGTLDKNGDFTASQPVPVSSPISKSTADQVRKMAYVARHAFNPNIDKALGYYVGGKTGTAEVITDGVYSKNGPNESETVASYLGYGGSEELSRYVIMVKVAGPQRGFQGSRDAGPVFTDISDWMLDYLKIQPKG